MKRYGTKEGKVATLPNGVYVLHSEAQAREEADRLIIESHKIAIAKLEAHQEALEAALRACIDRAINMDPFTLQQAKAALENSNEPR